jgi:hypothetical protein
VRRTARAARTGPGGAGSQDHPGESITVGARAAVGGGIDSEFLPRRKSGGGRRRLRPRHATSTRPPPPKAAAAPPPPSAPPPLYPLPLTPAGVLPRQPRLPLGSLFSGRRRDSDRSLARSLAPIDEPRTPRWEGENRHHPRGRPRPAAGLSLWITSVSGGRLPQHQNSCEPRHASRLESFLSFRLNSTEPKLYSKAQPISLSPDSLKQILCLLKINSFIRLPTIHSILLLPSFLSPLRPSPLRPSPPAPCPFVIKVVRSSNPSLNYSPDVTADILDRRYMIASANP